MNGSRESGGLLITAGFYRRDWQGSNGAAVARVVWTGVCPMRAVGRSFSVLVSAWAHVGVVLSLLAFAGGLPISADRGGEGAVDAGGEDFGAVTEDEQDFGSATAKLVSIAIVVDAPATAASPSFDAVATAPLEAVAKAPAKRKPAPASPPASVELPAANAEQSADLDVSRPSEATIDSVVDRTPTDVGANLIPGGKGRKPSGKGEKKSCPVVKDDGVEKLGEYAWSVERDVAEYYARNLKELQKIASVRLVKNDAGKPDGFRVGVPRCSILREGGLRSGDVVKSVNGVRVHDVFTAISAYFKLRREETIVLNVVRKGEKLTLRYTMV